MPTNDVMDWLKGKTPEDFAIIEHCGRLLWPIKLQRLKSDKKVSEEPAYLQVLDPLDLMDAKQAAARLFDARKFDKDDERYKDMWAMLEMYAQVAIALRDNEANVDGTHYQKHSVDILLDSKATSISYAEVRRLHSMLDIFSKFEDPRLDQMTVEEVMELVYAIAKARNLSPLVGIAGSAVDTFVMSMADLLMRFHLLALSSQPPEKSNKEASPTSNSKRSSAAKPGKSSAPSHEPAKPVAAPPEPAKPGE
jgi:hypothetical protein